MQVKTLDRIKGSLIGLATGDAMGVPLEFKRPGTFSPVSSMIGGGPFSLEPGEWTDDTSLALCLAESIIPCRGFDLIDQLNRYHNWYRNGHLSSDGTCFDIGTTTLRALQRFMLSGEPYPEEMNGPRATARSCDLHPSPCSMRETLQRQSKSPV